MFTLHPPRLSLEMQWDLVVYGGGSNPRRASIHTILLKKTLFKVRKFAESNSDLRPQLAHEVDE